MLLSSGQHHMSNALRLLARRGLGQLPRSLGSSRALRTSASAAQQPRRREPLAPLAPQRSLASSARAAAVDAPSSAPSSQTAGDGGKGLAPGVPTFQEAIARLQTYWAGVGCALWLPHNTEARAAVALEGLLDAWRRA